MARQVETKIALGTDEKESSMASKRPTTIALRSFPLFVCLNAISRLKTYQSCSSWKCWIPQVDVYGFRCAYVRFSKKERDKKEPRTYKDACWLFLGLPSRACRVFFRHRKRSKVNLFWENKNQGEGYLDSVFIIKHTPSMNRRKK